MGGEYVGCFNYREAKKRGAKVDPPVGGKGKFGPYRKYEL